MSTWLYQLNPAQWSPETFRFEIWEGKHWNWNYGTKRGSEAPAAGDTVIFFYAPTRGDDPGIYGWAVIERFDEANNGLYFIPVAPTDRLKMDPWWGENAKRIVDAIRGRMKQGTLFQVGSDEVMSIRKGIRMWLSCAG